MDATHGTMNWLADRVGGYVSCLHRNRSGVALNDSLNREFSFDQSPTLADISDRPLRCPKGDEALHEDSIGSALRGAPSEEFEVLANGVTSKRTLLTKSAPVSCQRWHSFDGVMTLMAIDAPGSLVFADAVDPNDSPNACSPMFSTADSASSSDYMLKIDRRRTHAADGFLDSLEDCVDRRSKLEHDADFQECARLIAKDMRRTFPGDPQVDQIRLCMADILRAHARRDCELGYVQGMCFVAAGVCLSGVGMAQAAEEFDAFIGLLRPLWLPGFPLINSGIPVLAEILTERDPELLDHLTSNAGVDWHMVIPGAWLSVFAKWLPIDAFRDTLPFVCKGGLAGLLTTTLLILLYNRDRLLGCRGLEEALDCINNLSRSQPPDRLLEMCTVSLPTVQARLDASRANQK
mmetsp:Transcript_101896/g.287538  ORF Transcript_101896/g.287538 Transcript_101896/m.287538 type:complete len:406 (+) Transcript_101896:75-1292(+)